MRIAMIGPFGLAPKGTMRVRALPLARALTARGHDVKIIMPPWHTQEPSRRWEEDGIALEYVSLAPHWPGLGETLVALRLVRSALAWKPDVIHCFKPKGHAGLAAWLIWHLQRLGAIHTRLVIAEDDWEGPGGWNDLEPYSPPLKAFFVWQECWGLRHNDAVTVASRTLQSLVWSRGAPPNRVIYLPNGVEAIQQGNNAAVRKAYDLSDAPVILLYTRFFEFDVARAVAVYQRVVAQIPEARLLVVGRGLFARDDARFDALVADAGLGDRVIRAGWVDQEALPDYFAATDVAFYPFDDTLVNRTKCSVKLTDLLGAGVAVVADAVGQNTEYIIHQETGLLTPAGDVEAMALSIVRLLCDESLRRQLGQAAAKVMHTHYTWSALAEQAIKAYESRATV